MKRVVVICPGRGTYTKETLGYLHTFGKPAQQWIEHLDQLRSERGWPTLTQMDSATAFQPQLHTKGEHASPLIYACSAIDFQSLNREEFEVVAITGNSMGWYSTLALSGALPEDAGFEVIQTMGAMMKDGVLGGQVLTTLVNEYWTFDAQKQSQVEKALDRLHSEMPNSIFYSIRLGGYLVLGATKEAIPRLLKELPKSENFPFQLVNHAAFHTPLLQGVSDRAFETIPPNWFQPPQHPIVDGRGAIWQPWSTEVSALYEYTLGHQVVQMYDYSKAIEVAAKEFAPDHFVLLGPGNSLGGATAQILIDLKWCGLRSKSEFQELQKSENPPLLSFGIPEQRSLLIATR